MSMQADLMKSLKDTGVGKNMMEGLNKFKKLIDTSPRARIITSVALVVLGALVFTAMVHGVHFGFIDISGGGPTSMSSLMTYAMPIAAMGLGLYGVFYCLDKHLENSKHPKLYSAVKKIRNIILPILMPLMYAGAAAWMIHFGPTQFAFYPGLLLAGVTVAIFGGYTLPMFRRICQGHESFNSPKTNVSKNTSDNKSLNDKKRTIKGIEKNSSFNHARSNNNPFA